MIAGFATLGILINLGPRIGRFLPDGTPVTIRPHNLPLTMVGLMLIFTGFFGFLMGCVIYSGSGYATIYATPTTLSAFAFNTLMGLAGGIIGAYVTSRGEPFWTISGGLAGVIAVASGMDLYHPALAFIIALAGGALVPYLGKLLEKFKIDDVVGAVAVHGGMGTFSVLMAGIFLWGYPNAEGFPPISLWGQLIGIVVFAALGFIPTYLVSLFLKKVGLLRIPAAVELQGLDLSEIPATPYPEGTPVTAMPTNGVHAVAVMEEVK
jgi:ammonia channel protein AmtB